MMDGIALSKVLPLFVYPLNVSIGLSLIALLLHLFRKSLAGWLTAAAAVAILCVASNPMIANYLVGEIERQYLPVAAEQSPTADAIVLLGGALGLKQPPRVAADLTASADRVLHTARLYRSGKAPIVIISGGNVFAQKNAEPESFYIAELLQEWGVPRRVLTIEGNSRNTYENALETKRIVDSRGLAKVLLVTSALHMPRALAVFRSAGINAIPAVTDVWVVQYDQPAVLDWLPSSQALTLTTLAIKERLGTWVYRLRGWIHN